MKKIYFYEQWEFNTNNKERAMLNFFEQTAEDLLSMGGSTKGEKITLGSTTWWATGWFAGDVRRAQNEIFVLWKYEHLSDYCK